MARSKRNIAGLVRKVLLVLVALGVAGAIVVSFLPKPVPVDVAKATRDVLEVSVDEAGQTRVKDRYIVSAPLTGNLSRISLAPGDEVEPGAVLARLLPLSPGLLDARQRAQTQAQVAAARAARKQAQATIARVQSALEFAKREAKRQRDLTERGAAAARTLERAELEERSRAEELASARFAAKVADHELRMAQAALGSLDPHGGRDQIEITSPVKGRVLKVIQKSEGVVQPGTQLLELGDPSALEIVVDVLTADAVHVRPGTRVKIERWGGDDTLAAHVRLVEPSAFTRRSALGVEEQRVNVVIDLDEPHERWASLGDGYRVEARIITWRSEDVLSVPSSAVFRSGKGWAAFRLEQQTAREVPLEIGRENDYRVQIESGLREGDRVIVHPGEQVKPGVAVEPR